MDWVIIEIVGLIMATALVYLSIYLHEIWLSKMSWGERKTQLKKIKDRNGRRWPY